jgi:putative PIN family toxin of toxin-antitoxin system
MRIVLDTNVLVSATLKELSTPAAAVRLVSASHVLLTSVATQHELRRILSKPYFQATVKGKVIANLDAMLADAELITITHAIIACRDPKDDQFLELAVNGKADYIISDDDDVLSMMIFRGISIITPARFLTLT